MVEELPAASWYAEHIMEWHKRYDSGRDPFPAFHWHDENGAVQADEEWDPKTHDADALHLWRQLPNPKELYVDEDGGIAVYGPKWAGAGSDEREAICRAAYVRHLLQQPVHHTGTGKDTP